MATVNLLWNLPQRLRYSPGEPLSLTLLVQNVSLEETTLRLETQAGGANEPLEVDGQTTFTIPGVSVATLQGETVLAGTNATFTVRLVDAATGLVLGTVATELFQDLPSVADVANPIVNIAVAIGALSLAAVGVKGLLGRRTA